MRRRRRPEVSLGAMSAAMLGDWKSISDSTICGQDSFEKCFYSGWVGWSNRCGRMRSTDVPSFMNLLTTQFRTPRNSPGSTRTKKNKIIVPLQKLAADHGRRKYAVCAIRVLSISFLLSANHLISISSFYPFMDDKLFHPYVTRRGWRFCGCWTTGSIRPIIMRDCHFEAISDNLGTFLIRVWNG